MKYTLVLIFIFLVSCGKVQQTDDDFIVVDLPHIADNRPDVDVYIDGEGPFNFLVDTGASFSSISKELAEELNIIGTDKNFKDVKTVDNIQSFVMTDFLTINISDKRVSRKTKLAISDDEVVINVDKKLDGIIGISELYGGKIENFPDNKILRLSLAPTLPDCDQLNSTSYCSKLQIHTVDFQLKNHIGKLILDTGSSYKDLIMFKSHFTNSLWVKSQGEFQGKTNAAISNKTLGFFRADNFIINDGPNCIGEFVIKDPQDSSPLFIQTFGVMGWPLLNDYHFSIDYKTNKVYFDNSTCPYKKVKTLGVSGVGLVPEETEVILTGIVVGEAADKAGVREGDIVEKLILSNGVVLEHFSPSFFDMQEHHAYAPPGSKVTYFIRREDGVKKFEVIAALPAVLELE